MSRKVLLAATALVMSVGYAQADAIYTLSNSSDPIFPGQIGTPPFFTVDVSLIDSTEVKVPGPSSIARVTVVSDTAATFGIVGLNTITDHVRIDIVSFVPGPIGTSPQFLQTFDLPISGSGVDYGTFHVADTASPFGFGRSVFEADFFLTNIDGTWSNSGQVLTPNSLGFNVGIVAFDTKSGEEFAASDSSKVCTDPQCSFTSPLISVPEPSTILDILGGVFGLGLLRYNPSLRGCIGTGRTRGGSVQAG
jgi:hypothetical protein